MINFRRFIFMAAAMLLISSTSFANMKKGRVASEGIKYYAFTNASDGPCSVSMIYDSLSADLDVGIGEPESGDLLCIGVASQKNYDACSAGLPPLDYIVVVQSYKGASNFRVVVTCGDQQSLSAAGTKISGTSLREIEESSATRKIADRIKKVAAKKQ